MWTRRGGGMRRCVYYFYLFDRLFVSYIFISSGCSTRECRRVRSFEGAVAVVASGALAAAARVAGGYDARAEAHAGKTAVGRWWVARWARAEAGAGRDAGGGSDTEKLPVVSAAGAAGSGWTGRTGRGPAAECVQPAEESVVGAGITCGSWTSTAAAAAAKATGCCRGGITVPSTTTATTTATTAAVATTTRNAKPQSDCAALPRPTPLHASGRRAHRGRSPRFRQRRADTESIETRRGRWARGRADRFWRDGRGSGLAEVWQPAHGGCAVAQFRAIRSEPRPRAESGRGEVQHVRGDGLPVDEAGGKGVCRYVKSAFFAV